MELRQKQTRNESQKKMPKTSREINLEIKEEINKRLDAWSIEKKEISHKLHPVNKKSTQEKLFDIMPWTIWWFVAGENVGRELGSHVNHDNTFNFRRPCIVISKLKSLEDTDHNIITILPMSTKSDGLGIHKKFIHKLEAIQYPKTSKINRGLKNDSYIVCHQMKTIDTKRLLTQVTTRILDEDIKEIKMKMQKYLDLV